MLYNRYSQHFSEYWEVLFSKTPSQLRDNRVLYAYVRLYIFTAEIFGRKHKDKFVFVYDHEMLWGRRSIAPFILNLRTTYMGVVNLMLRPL